MPTATQLLARRIEEATDLNADQALAIAIGAEPLWAVLDELGLADAWGGSESHRVVPLTIKTLLMAANPMRYDCPACSDPIYGEAKCPLCKFLLDETEAVT